MKDKICKNCKRHFIEEIAFDYPQSCCHISEGHGKTTEPFLTCNEFEYNSEYLEKKVNQLQSNWNSLREYITQLKNSYMETDNIFDDAKFRILLSILDKMNELEGNDNNE